MTLIISAFELSLISLPPKRIRRSPVRYEPADFRVKAEKVERVAVVPIACEEVEKTEAIVEGKLYHLNDLKCEY